MNDMARVAGGIIAQNNINLQSDGKYRAEGFDIALNSYVRVVYTKKKIDGKTYNSVTTMFPVKSITIK